MKIVKNDIDITIKNPKNFYGFLLYGSDIGVINAREKQIKTHLSEKELIALDLVEEKNMRDVFNECFTSSFFNPSKLIFIIGSEASLNGMEDIINKLPLDFQHFIVICIRDNLDAKSKIRKLCEESPKIATIACYPDEEADIINIVNTFAKTNNLQLSRDIIIFISQKFKNNRGVLLLELEKLKLHSQNQVITLSDVIKIMDASEEANLFEAINLLFSFKIKKFLQTLETLEADGIPPSVLALNITNYILKLISILEEKEETKKTFDQILNEKKIFFKQIPIMKDHLTRFNLTSIHELLQKVILLEIEVRTAPALKYLQIKKFAFTFC